MIIKTNTKITSPLYKDVLFWQSQYFYEVKDGTDLQEGQIVSSIEEVKQFVKIMIHTPIEEDPKLQRIRDLELAIAEIVGGSI